MCPLMMIFQASIGCPLLFVTRWCSFFSRLSDQQQAAQEGAEDLISTPPFITSMAPSQTELDFLIKGVKEDVRSDGRARTDYRYVVFS